MIPAPPVRRGKNHASSQEKSASGQNPQNPNPGREKNGEETRSEKPEGPGREKNKSRHLQSGNPHLSQRRPPVRGNRPLRDEGGAGSRRRARPVRGGPLRGIDAQGTLPAVDRGALPFPH